MIVLKVGGKSFTGWTKAQVTRGLDQLAGAFNVQLTEPFPGRPDKWEIKLGDSCTVEAGGHQLLAGWIEEFPIEYTHDSHTVEIAGRDATGDLVDCSHAEDNFKKTVNEWLNVRVEKIIQALCAPFKITVLVDESAVQQAQKTLDKFKPNEGDSVSESILRICKSLAILPVSYGDGYLRLTRAGSESAIDSLELGRNVKRGVLYQSNTDRFGKYVVKGQAESKDEYELYSTTQPFGESPPDRLVTRHRPLVIIGDSKLDKGACRERAEWEARVRAGNCRYYKYLVQGWLQSDGSPWPLNALVRVKDSILGVDDTLLIFAQQFLMDESQGTTTELAVCSPGKYEILSSMHPLEKIKTSGDSTIDMELD